MSFQHNAFQHDAVQAGTVTAHVTIAVPCGTLELGPKTAGLPLLLTREGVGYPPTVVIEAASADTIISVPAGSLTLTGNAPTVVNPVALAMPVGALTLTGFAPTVVTNVTVPVPAGALTLTGFAPTVVTNRTVSVPAGTLTLTALTPAVVTNVGVAVPAGVLTLTGYEPSVLLGDQQIVQVPAGELALTGFAPDVDIAPVPVAPPADTEQPSGGYAAANWAAIERQRARARRRLEEEDEDESKTPAVLPSAAQAGPGSADATPQAPAADLELTRQLVAYWSGEADREQLNRRAQRALDYALRAQSVLAMQLFERELARQMEDDDFAAVLMLLADD